MMKTGDLLVEQDDNFGDIRITVKDPDHLAGIDLGWAVSDAAGEARADERGTGDGNGQ